MRKCSGCGLSYEETVAACPLCGQPYNAEEVSLETDSRGRVNLIMNRHSEQRITSERKSEIQLSYARCMSGAEDGYAVTGCWDTSLENITIPDSYMDQPVLMIAAGAFKGMTRVQKVTLPAKLREIGESAFENCKSLRCVLGGEKLIHIGEQAFRGCVLLEQFEVLKKPDVGFPNSAFAGCYYLPLYPRNK